jgi:Txe/YoeB family toxin of Txe-Axe toxin-antitoxin module
MKKILTLFCIMLNLVLFAQQTKSLVYFNPKLGGNENMWNLANYKSDYLIGSAGIKLPETVGNYYIRRFDKSNKLIWEFQNDTFDIGSYEALYTQSNDIFLISWYKTSKRDEEYLHKMDSTGSITKSILIDVDTIKNQNRIVEQVNIIRDTIVLTHAKWISPGPDSVFFLFYDKDLNPLRRIALTENRKWDIALGIHGTMDGNFIYTKHFKSETDFYDDSIGVYKIRPDGSTVWKYKQGISFNNTPFRDFLVINSDSTSSFFTNIEKNFNDKMKFPNFPIITKLSNDGDTIWVCRLINKDYKVIYKMEGNGKDGIYLCRVLQVCFSKT